MDVTLSFEQVKRWGVKGGLSILDQGVYSSANFVLTILLARWLDSELYGAFSIAFAVYIFFTGIYNALILEPMSVLGVANYSDNLPQYILAQFKLHLVIASLLGLSMIGMGFSVGKIWPASLFVRDAIIGAGGAFLFMVIPWIVRRKCYMTREPEHALVTSIVYSMALGVGLVIIVYLDELTNLKVWFGLMGAAGLISGLPQIVQVWRKSNHNVRHLDWNALLKEQWSFGRWVFVATLLYSISTQSQLIVAAGIMDLRSAGAWRALQNFTLPIMQSVAAVTAFAIPALSAEFGASNFQGLKRKGYLVAGVMTLGACIYEAVLILSSAQLEKWVYAGKYESYAWMIPILGASSVLFALSSGFSLMIRSMQRPIYYFIINLIGAVLSVASAIWMTQQWGIAGALWSNFSVSAALLVVNLFLYKKWFSALSKSFFKSKGVIP
jgi:O-antigen/teichoic acid export membrane protein